VRRADLLLVVLIFLCPTAAWAAGFDGVWVGRCLIADADVFVRLRLRNEANGVRGEVYSRLLGIRNAPVLNVRRDGSRIALSFGAQEGAVQLSCTLREDELEGVAEYRGSRGACAFRRRQEMGTAAFDAFRGNYKLASDHVVFICGGYDWGNRLFLADGERRVELIPIGQREFLAEDLRTVRFEADDKGAIVAAIVSQSGQVPRQAPRVRLYEQEQVTFANGEVRLAGVLLLPPGPGPHPALVFVHGSGPGTRGQYPFEADRFARQGIAVLAFDKRGAGESTGNWRLADFDVLAEDVLAGVHYLRQDRRIRADKIGLWGISQAGWIIPLAAAGSEEVAFIVPVSGGAVTPAEQEVWRQPQNLEYLQVPERFIDLDRKVATLGYDWERLNRVTHAAQHGRCVVEHVQVIIAKGLGNRHAAHSPFWQSSAAWIRSRPRARAPPFGPTPCAGAVTMTIRCGCSRADHTAC
jgi:pimeloyl-ACP methyl ester carboxylesterase